MKRTVPLLVLALLLALSTAAFAGGEKCAHDAAAHKAMAAKLAAHGWLGIETEKDAEGAYRVTKVAAGSPAAEAGFRSGDVLVALNGVKLSAANKEAVKKAKSKLGVGKPVAYTVRRDGGETTLTATLAPGAIALLSNLPIAGTSRILNTEQASRHERGISLVVFNL